MARILEAFKKNDANKNAPVAAAVPPLRVLGSEEKKELSARVPAAGPAAEEVPYIEVGGSKMEASPSVLGSRPAQIGAAGVRQPVAEPRPPGVLVSESRPMTSFLPPNVQVVPAAVSFQPVVGAVPVKSPGERFASELIAFHRPEHPVSQQYRALLSQLVPRNPAGEPAPPAHVLFFTSPFDGAGTTSVVLNVAVAYARRGLQRVVVVDANGQRPAVAQRLGLPTSPGLPEVLTGAVTLQRALQESGQPNFQVLAAGEASARSCLAVKSLGSTLNHLKKRFDLVLIDAPSWTGAAENQALASISDSVYLVLPQDRTDATEVKELTHALPRQGIPLRGCILRQM